MSAGGVAAVTTPQVVDVCMSTCAACTVRLSKGTGNRQQLHHQHYHQHTCLLQHSDSRAKPRKQYGFENEQCNMQRVIPGLLLLASIKLAASMIGVGVSGSSNRYSVAGGYNTSPWLCKCTTLV
jgi:hypothetical protein